MVEAFWFEETGLSCRLFERPPSLPSFWFIADSMFNSSISSITFEVFTIRWSSFLEQVGESCGEPWLTSESASFKGILTVLKH